jgi:hypothetical protein
VFKQGYLVDGRSRRMGVCGQGKKGKRKKEKGKRKKEKGKRKKEKGKRVVTVCVVVW